MVPVFANNAVCAGNIVVVVRRTEPGRRWEWTQGNERRVYVPGHVGRAVAVSKVCTKGRGHEKGKI